MKGTNQKMFSNQTIEWCRSKCVVFFFKKYVKIISTIKYTKKNSIVKNQDKLQLTIHIAPKIKKKLKYNKTE